MLISRFLFDLQEASADTTGSESRGEISSRTTSLNFARVVGTIGSTLVSRDEQSTRSVVETFELEAADKTRCAAIA